MLVAEAMVQELLVSLLDVRTKEKEAHVMNEVEDVELMRSIHFQLEADEQLVSSFGDQQDPLPNNLTQIGGGNRFAIEFVLPPVMTANWRNCR